MYNKFGFIDRPLNPSGVPPIERRYSPVGFEGELERVKAAINAFLRGSDNIAVVIVGQYGWGKSELLDAVEAVAQGLGLRVLRLPLTFGLDINVVINSLLKARGNSNEPLLVLIDEADEVSRAVELSNALSPGDAAKVRDLVIKLGSLIRALIEPRNYRDVLGVDPRRLGRVMLVLAFTPQLYYNILRNLVPDVFDITRGRVYAEVVLDERMPLWLYEAMLIQRFNAYSSDERLNLVRRGLMNSLYPLRREYLTTLYELVANTEGGKASPRALVKFTSKLLDMLVDKGKELNYAIFEEFLTVESSIGELKVHLDVINEGPSDERVSRVFKALLLSGIPRTINELNSELGFDVSSIINALIKAGFVEEVQVAGFRLSGDSLNRINSELVKLSLPPIEGDLRDISISFGLYYTAYENEPMIYIILPSNVKTNLPNVVKAYQISPRLHRILVFGREPEEIVRAKEEISKAISIVNSFRDELAMEIVKAALNTQLVLYPIAANTWAGVLENPLDARMGILVSIDSDQNQLSRLLNKVINEGVITINGQERTVDALLVIVISRSLLTNDLTKMLMGSMNNLSWKVVLGPVSDFVNFSVFGSDGIDRLRSIIIGSRLERLSNVPREYMAFLEELGEYRDSISAFRDKVRQRVLQYTMAIRRGAKESKEFIIRRIVDAWIKGEDLSDQPEVFRDEGGKAKVSVVEESFINYLRSLGKPSFTVKELEYLVRRLYPTHLWREFRENDLIRLLRLRGLLLPINEEFTEYAPYSPNAVTEALNALSRYMAKLNDSITKPLIITIEPLNMKIEIKPGINIQSNDCEKLLSILRAIPETSSDFLRRYSSFMICIDKLEGEIEEKLEELNNDVTTVSTQLNSTIKDLMGKINDIKKGLGNLPKISTEVETKVNNVLEKTRTYLERLNGLELDNLKESLPTILDAINSEVNKIMNLMAVLRSIEDEIREYAEMTNTLLNASSIINQRVAAMDIDDFVNDLILLLKLDSMDSLSNYLNELRRVVEARRRELSDTLSRVNSLIDRYTRIIAWLRKRGDNVIISKLLDENLFSIPSPSPTYDNAKYIADTIRNIDKIFDEVSKRLGVPKELLIGIASLGPNVGINEEELAREYGLEVSVINKYLESMWKAGLIDRKYVT